MSNEFEKNIIIKIPEKACPPYPPQATFIFSLFVSSVLILTSPLRKPYVFEFMMN